MKYILSALCFLTLLTSCLQNDVVLKSSPHIKTFKFNSHTEVPSIERTVFTVDTINCLIYNEDSVTYGCNLTKLMPTLTYTGTPQKIKVNDVEWDGSDSIDFTNAVSMYILSQNKQNEATYTISVNQHTVNPDEIIWKNPITLTGNASSFKVVATDQTIYTFVYEPIADEYTYTVYSLNGNSWTQVASFTSEYSITSLATFQDKIYATEQTGLTLLEWELDKWESVANLSEGKMTTLLGSINQALWIASQNNEGATSLLFYNAEQISTSNKVALPNQFALNGATSLQTPYGLYLIGGEQDGVAQNCIVSTDNGYYWTNILNQSGKYSILPCYNAICAYYNHRLYVIGGLNSHQVVANNYYSDNNGYSWTEMPSYQQLPAAFTYKDGACAAVCNDNIYIFNAQNHALQVWEGRIRKVDFIRK